MSVTYQDLASYPSSVSVIKFLLSKEYDLANRSGRALNSLTEAPSVGILYKDPEARSEKYLFGLIEIKPRRIHLGTLHFDNNILGATNENWYFEIFGQVNAELAKQLANEMSSLFGTNINIRLVCRELRFESRPWDSDF